MSACGRRGIGALTHDELRELALLYRQTAADLSVARDDPASAPLARHLNALLGRAHNLIYSGRAPRTRGIFQFYARVFPAVFRRTLPYTLAALALFAAGAAAGAAMADADPSFERVVLGGGMMDTIEAGRMWTHSIVGIKPLASSAIMTNNISVSLAAFAGGILGGVGTVYMMLFNGLLIGVIAVACQRAGLALSLWSFVAPHGVLELPAIFIAGGAGLMLARALHRARRAAEARGPDRKRHGRGPARPWRDSSVDRGGRHRRIHLSVRRASRHEVHDRRRRIRAPGRLCLAYSGSGHRRFRALTPR